MPRINSIDFYQNRPKIVIFAKKIKIFRVLGDPPLHPMPPVAGGLAPDPNCLRWLGIRPQIPATSPPPIADFWLRACLKKNLLHVTAGIHLY